VQLRVRLFSQVEVALGTVPQARFPTHKAAALFAYLVLQRGRPQRREALAARFWGEHSEADARKALRTELWRVRSVVEPQGVPPGTFLESQGPCVAFNVASAYWLDIEDFERKLTPFIAGRGDGAASQPLEEVQAALDLYRGDLLEGLDEEWCIYERQRLSSLYVHATQRLIDALIQRAEWGRAVAEAQRLLAYDPLIEHVHRDAMRGYAELDNRAAFVRQYRMCADVLGRELGVEPSYETRTLYEDIQRQRRWAAGGGPAPFATAGRRNDLDMASALTELQDAKRRLADATSLLQHAIDTVERLTADPLGAPVEEPLPETVLRRR
jgi:DNA-binding SARP family transcriptional activator